MDTIYMIHSLHESDVVTDGMGCYGVVRRCIHGEMFYAYLPLDKVVDDEIIKLVSDLDDGHLICCD